MLAAILLIMPILVAVFVVIYVERVRPVTQRINTFRYVFDGVSATLETLVDNSRSDEAMAQQILETLINELIESGWDNPDEALRDNQETPFIVQAFKNCNVELKDED